MPSTPCWTILVTFPFQFHFLYLASFSLIIVGVVVYSLRPPPVAPEQGDYREMRPTDDPEPAAPLGPHTGVAYHTQRHNTANHTAESTAGDVVVGIDKQNGTPAVPAENSTTPTTVPATSSVAAQNKKVVSNNMVPHSEQYTRLSIVQDDERLN